MLRLLFGRKKASDERKPEAGALVSKKRRDPKAVNRLIKYLLGALGKVGQRRLIAMIALALIQTWVSNRSAYLQGGLFKAIFLRKRKLVLFLLMQDVGISLVQSILVSSVKSLTENLGSEIRVALTNRLNRNYFDNNVFYRLSHVDKRIENPEEVFTTDVTKLSDGLAAVAASFTQAALDTVFYTYRLSSFAGVHYSAVMYSYVAIGGVVVAAVAPNFGRILSKLQSLEGAYSSTHSSIASNAEAIAFLGGSDTERDLVLSHFSAVFRQQSLNIKTQWVFGIVRDFVLKYMGATVAVYIILWPFFKGDLRSDGTLAGHALQLSNMRYFVSVVISNFSGLGALALSSRQLDQLSGHAFRICNLIDSLDEIAGDAESSKSTHFEEADHIEFSDVEIRTPAGELLASRVSFKVERGKPLLVVGPNGSGKSSLFRVLGGLWPVGEGVVSRPGAKHSGLSRSVYYVPQRPYVSIGTLSEQITYPLSLAEAKANGEDLSDEMLRELLTSVHLTHLLDRVGTSAVVDWDKVLSLGEMQRLGMARLFYHSPTFGILDECTSAVTAAMEHSFYLRVAALGITAVTISHRPALTKFHHSMFSLDGFGGWSIKEIDHVLNPSAASRISDDEEKVEIVEISHAPALPAGGPSSPPTKPAEKSLGSWRELRRLWCIMVPSWTCSEIGLLAGVAAVVCARVALSDRIASLNGKTVSFMISNDLEGFKRLLLLSLVQSVASAISAPTLTFLTSRLGLQWRRRLSLWLVNRYVNANIFYKVTQLGYIEDANERMTRDVEALATQVANLIPTAIKPLVDILWFTTQMHTLLGPKGILILYGYMTAGFTVLRLASPDLTAIVENDSKLESSFRYFHNRLRSHAESVAFFGGGAREQNLIEKKFRQISASGWDRLRKHFRFEILEDFVTKQLPPIASWSASLAFALSHPPSDDPATSSHDLRYLASVVSHTFLAFGEILELFNRVEELRGRAIRISQLDQALRIQETAATDLSHVRHTSNYFKFDEVDISTPNGILLAHKLSLEINPNSNLLITGQNGSGKSSIARVLHELWPIFNGKLARPPHFDAGTKSQNIFFVPQRPYMCNGSLRDQIFYPLTRAGAMARGFDVSDEILTKLFSLVKLDYLPVREGWESVRDWNQILSLGEQQKIGMARVYFHRPHFVVLDEATNAISVDVEEQLYHQAMQMGMTLITITQRPALVRLHALELRLMDGNGDWSLRQLTH